MTALQVIDQIKSLPPKEQAQVFDFLHELETGLKVAHMDEKTFEVSSEKVFTQHADLMQKLAVDEIA